MKYSLNKDEIDKWNYTSSNHIIQATEISEFVMIDLFINRNEVCNKCRKVSLIYSVIYNTILF